MYNSPFFTDTVLRDMIQRSRHSTKAARAKGDWIGEAVSYEYERAIYKELNRRHHLQELAK